jgi:hypothetical protein
MSPRPYAASLSLLTLWNASAHARSLESVIDRGTLTLCASPNAHCRSIGQSRDRGGRLTPMTVGWFNLIPAFGNDSDLNWNIAAGLLRPDDKLQQRVDAAIEALLADGSIARIYARYGIELRPPQ